ncbi:MAG: 16S rRNA (guanine(527)-N(7))-methyltransferase RsmG [Lactobacillaceae bacterium]|jgi:16S rRNA (guanine527-N7)-methyltransferase|nr:16S rRNA (guanine(527)-N(7))-methyltransferase RsmG [Lactobacillaceae bacterium]
MESLEKKYNVSRETISELRAYEASLKEWQSKLNLVSRASLEDAWNRHFLDSMQLYKLIPDDAKVIYDFGSGAGFPGMVLAIMLKNRTPYLNINLIESIGKKTVYLNEVKKITRTNVNIINDRVENIKPQTADVITSRAMASLDKLLGYVERFCGKKTKCIFPKGRSYQNEVEEAKKLWKFNLEVLENEQSDEGVILVVTNISKAKGAK